MSRRKRTPTIAATGTAQKRWQPAENVLVGDDGHHAKIDGQTPEFGHDFRQPDGFLWR